MHLETRARLRTQLLHYIDTHTTDYAESVMTVPAAHYHDPAHLAREIERVVRVNPMIAAHASELAEPGARVAVSTGGPALTVTREADGTLRARVGGRPVDFPLDEYAGLVWLVPTEGGRLDLRARLGPELDRDVQASEVGSAHLYRKREFHLAMNWKLAMEGFTDAYHLQFVHPRTVGPFFHTNIYRVDRYGQNWRMVTARRGIEDFRDAGPDGRAGLERFPDFAIAGINVYPASVLARAPAHFEVWGIRPDLADPGHCWVTLYFLVPELPVTERAVRFREKNWQVVLAAVRDEDWVVARSVGESLASGALPHVVYGRNEKCTQVFHGLLRRDLARAGEHPPEPPT